MDLDPTERGLQVGLVIGIALAYLVALCFFAVQWLSFGHTDLKDLVIGGFGFLASTMTLIVGHYIGGLTTARNLKAGAALGRPLAPQGSGPAAAQKPATASGSGAAPAAVSEG